MPTHNDPNIAEDSVVEFGMNLPDELLLNVLMELLKLAGFNYSQLVALRYVSKQFSRLVFDNLLWMPLFPFSIPINSLSKGGALGEISYYREAIKRFKTAPFITIYNPGRVIKPGEVYDATDAVCCEYRHVVRSMIDNQNQALYLLNRGVIGLDNVAIALRSNKKIVLGAAMQDHGMRLGVRLKSCKKL